MRKHIAEKWSAKYPGNWFDLMLEFLDERERGEIEANRNRIRSRMSEGEIALSDDEEDQLVMDIPMFLNAVKSRRDLFHKLTDRELTEDIKGLYEIRNLWAHPPLRDLSKPVVDNAIKRCVNVLTVFDENAKDAVFSLSGPTDELSPFDEIQEQLSNIRNLLGPVERQQETLVSLSESVISLQAAVDEIKDQLNEDAAVDPENEDLAEQLQTRITSVETAMSANLQTMQEQLSAQISEVGHGVSENRDQIKDIELWPSSLVEPVAKIQKQVQRLESLIKQGAKRAAPDDVLRFE